MNAQTQTNAAPSKWGRWLDRFATGIFLLPVILVPLIFSITSTNSLIIKEPLFQISTAMLMALFPLTYWVRENIPARFVLLLGLLGAYLLFSAWVIAPHPRAWMEFIRWLGCLSFALIAAAACMNSQRRNLFIIFTVLTSALVSLYAIAQAFEIEPFLAWETFAPEGSDVRRVCSSLCNPDYLAGYVVGVLPLTAALAFYHRGAVRALCALVSLMHLFALFFTYSRGGWAAAVVTACLFIAIIYFRPAQIRKDASGFSWKWAAASSMAALFIIAAASIFLRDEISGWAYRFSNLSSDMSIQSRAYYYFACIQMWLDRPFTGHGIGSFALQFHEFRPKELAQLMTFRVFHVDHAHNEWLEILAETGLVGFTLYASLIASSLWFCWRASKTAPASIRGALIGLCLGAVAVLIHNLFTVTLRYTPSAFLLWSFLGVAVATAATQIPSKPVSANGKRAAAVLLLIFAPVLFYYSMNFYVGDRLIQEGKARLYSKIHYEQSRETNRLEMQRALVSLHKGIELSPSRIESHSYIGLSYNKALDYVQADELYQEVQSIHPHFTSVLMNLSVNQLQWAEFINNPAYFPERVPPYAPLMADGLRKAVQWAEMGAQDDPFDPVYPHLLARSYFYLGELDQAETAFQQTIEKSMALSEDTYRSEISDSRNFLERIQRIQSQPESP
ncbi:MAG: O-antigen ligase family protein [Candidatus Hinthialibacter antarcticus]|nr:O-antigen ligase family protein [Candidatus Hinthialibacter antarcticus]